MPTLGLTKEDYIIAQVDADAKTAIETWHGKLSPTEKTAVGIDGNFVTSKPDAADQFGTQRTELMDLIKANAKEPTDVVRIRFSGPTVLSLGFIKERVADPEDTK